MKSTLFRVVCSSGAASAPAAATDPYIANVVFLWGSSAEADASTTFTDESTATNKGAGTASGNAQVDTAQAAFSGGSLLCDGTGDYVAWADHADFRLAADNDDLYTIEFWFRPVSYGDTWFLGQAGGGGNFGWSMYSNGAAGNFEIALNYSSNGNVGGAITAVGTGTKNLAANTWHYIAVSKNASGKIRIWRNGTLDASATPADSSIFDSSNAFELGRGLASASYNGWIDEVRITKGVCRYDTDDAITVPTAKFPRT